MVKLASGAGAGTFCRRPNKEEDLLASAEPRRVGVLSIEALMLVLIVRVVSGGEKGRLPTGETDRMPLRASPRKVGSGTPRILRRMVYLPSDVDLLRRAFLKELSESLSLLTSLCGGCARGRGAVAAAAVARGICFFCRAARG